MTVQNYEDSPFQVHVSIRIRMWEAAIALCPLFYGKKIVNRVHKNVLLYPTWSIFVVLLEVVNKVWFFFSPL